MNWTLYGMEKPPEGAWVLLRADWRIAGQCPYAVVQRQGDWWLLQGLPSKFDTHLDDLWMPVPRPPR